MPGKACRVVYKDLDGVRHCVEVVAESVYEASVLALSALSKHEWIESVGPGTRLDIQIIEPNVTHTLLVAQLKQWLDRPATSPADSVKKRKLKELLAS
jgi:hypothetical protein